MKPTILWNPQLGHWLVLRIFQYLCSKTTAMKKEIDPKESPRGRAFELWKTAGMPKVSYAEKS
jgi:hypothetical protein